MPNIWRRASLLYIKASQNSVLEFLHDVMMSIKAVNKRKNKNQFRQDSSSAVAVSSSSFVAEYTSLRAPRV